MKKVVALIITLSFLFSIESKLTTFEIHIDILDTVKNKLTVMNKDKFYSNRIRVIGYKLKTKKHTGDRMKTMMNLDGTKIIRVSDEKASRLFHDDGFKYVAKSVWKEKVRDVEKPTEEKPTKKTKTNKMSKAQKRHLKKSK